MLWYNLELLPVADVMTLFQITNVINQGTEQPCSSRQKKALSWVKDQFRKSKAKRRKFEVSDRWFFVCDRSDTKIEKFGKNLFVIQKNYGNHVKYIIVLRDVGRI